MQHKKAEQKFRFFIVALLNKTFACNRLHRPITQTSVIDILLQKNASS
jgi:hypothetical protein